MSSATQRKLVKVAPILVMLGVMLSAVAAQAQLRWAKAAPFPEPEEELYGVTANGKMYVLGGYGSNPFGNPSGLNYEYDPATDKWTKKKDMPLKVHHQAQVEYQGKIYVFGGYLYPEPGAWQPVDNAWVYDPATNTWSILPSMPVPRHGVAGAFLGNKLHLVSGKVTSSGAADTPLQTAEHGVLEIPSR